jgi:hypothetical protein
VMTAKWWPEITGWTVIYSLKLFLRKQQVYRNVVLSVYSSVQMCPFNIWNTYLNFTIFGMNIVTLKDPPASQLQFPGAHELVV